VKKVLLMLIILSSNIAFAANESELKNQREISSYGSSFYRFKKIPRSDRLVFFRCLSERCERLKFVIEGKTKFTMNVTDIPEFRDIFLKKVEIEAEAEQSKDVYFDTKNVDVPEFSLGVTFIQAIVDTLQAPMHLSSREDRVNKLREDLSVMIDKILDPTFSKSILHFDLRQRELVEWNVHSLFVNVARELKREGFEIKFY